MNQAALLDGLLALTAFWLAAVAWQRHPALRLGSLLLGAAATLGALRFSGLLALPQWHQYFSLLGAGAGLPLVAVALVAPDSAVARQPRYAWILTCGACVVCTVLVVVLQVKVWSAATALGAAVTLVVVGGWRRQAVLALAGLCMLVALLLFASKAPVPLLAPGDVLHLGLAAALWLVGWHHRALPATILAGQAAESPACPTHSPPLKPRTTMPRAICGSERPESG